MAYLDRDAVEFCRKHFKKGNITLYLGAGVSMGSGLPSWDKLILAMYFATISEQQLRGWRPFPNYLYAIAEWYLNNNSEPLEITARKLLKFYNSEHSETAFSERLYTTLYGNLLTIDGDQLPHIDGSFFRSQNSTLKALAEICKIPTHGINSVITYNYDNLLEISLENFPHKAIYKEGQSYKEEELPIFHVHGYVPLSKNPDSSKGFDLVFTEDKYNQIASNVYHWSNLIQIQKMSNSVGIMVGLSLSDRNMRRLLDAVRNAPINSKNFALLKRPDYSPPDIETLDKIHQSAIRLLDKFEQSGIKSAQDIFSTIFARLPGAKSDRPMIKSENEFVKGATQYQYEISGIIEAVKRYDLGLQEHVLSQLRITPVWFDKFSEIPKILHELTHA
jgi:hypothetical protein